MGLFKVNHNNIMGKFVEEAGQYNVKILPSSVAKESRSKKPMPVSYTHLDVYKRQVFLPRPIFSSTSLIDSPCLLAKSFKRS